MAGKRGVIHRRKSREKVAKKRKKVKLCVLKKEVSDEKVGLRVTNIVNNDGVLCICLEVSDFSVNVMLDTNTYDFIDINATIGYHSYIGSDYFEPEEL